MTVHMQNQINSLKYTNKNAVITGWDFSTGSVKCLAFDLQGNVLCEFRGTTDLVENHGAVELNAMMLEGQARSSVRSIAGQLKKLGRLKDWVCGGISATHHSAGRIDQFHNPIRRLICWNDQTLAEYHAKGMKRLGGEEAVAKLLGGPWAVRYSLSHLVKDETSLTASDWQNTKWILPHGPLAAGYLTGRYDCTSVSSAASTGMMDFRTNQWQPNILSAIENKEYRELAKANLPKIIDMNDPIGVLAKNISIENDIDFEKGPLVFPTLDDQAAGLIGGGATEAGEVAIVLGNSAVVNSSAATAPSSNNLDAMKLNWGPYLWMRCYSNGAQFVDRVVGEKPDWKKLEAAATAVPAGCGGVEVLPFERSEPSIGVLKPWVEWTPSEPSQPGDAGLRLRAAYEAVANLIALGVQAHEANGQKIKRFSVSGGIAKSQLMCEILASTLNRSIHRLVSSEGTALGAAVVALAGYETMQRLKHGEKQAFTAADAVASMVRFKDEVKPNESWAKVYQVQLQKFSAKIKNEKK